MSKQAKVKTGDSKQAVKQYRLCWLETNLVSATVDAKSAAKAVKKLDDHNDDQVTLIYGHPLPTSVWCVGTETKTGTGRFKFEDIPQSIVDLIESLNIDLECHFDDEMSSLKDPGNYALLRLIEKQNKVASYEEDIKRLNKIVDVSMSKTS